MDFVIHLNNHAVDIMLASEERDFRKAAVVLHRALDAFKVRVNCLSPSESHANQLLNGCGWCVPRRPDQLRVWSTPIMQAVDSQTQLFLYSRAMRLSLPASSEQGQVALLHEEDYYASVLCFNTALCYHMLSMEDDEGKHDASIGNGSLVYSTKAHSLYTLAFEAMTGSSSSFPWDDSALQIVIFNNVGHLHFHNGIFPEGVACFRIVKDLLLTKASSADVSGFDAASEDFHEMALNTLVNCNASPAA